MIRAPVPPPRRPAPVITGNGIIRGVIHFQGTPPAMRDIPNVPCHTGAQPQKEETVIISPTGGLKNVIVSLEGVGTGAPRADNAAVLDQKDCRYVPHVIAITAGQPLTIHSSDDTMHNIHIDASQNPPVNLGMTAAGQQKNVTFARPEIMRVKCDVHPWMSAYIGVFENPLFAISADDGSFQITGVPAGTYTLTAWHELYGEQKISVTVSDDKPATVESDIQGESELQSCPNPFWNIPTCPRNTHPIP